MSNKMEINPHTVSTERCTMCNACVNICPYDAISNAGGGIPLFNINLCKNCGLCSMACPACSNQAIFNQRPVDVNNIVFACRYKDYAKSLLSASGGVFSMLAETIFQTHAKAVVFGAAWNDSLQVRHVAIKSVSDLWKLRKSKYVCSDIGNTYAECLAYLQDGYFVLYSGTPCQIVGLNNFLSVKSHDIYKNHLLTVDLICRGTPPQKIFDDYIQDYQKKYNLVVHRVEFRYKHKSFGKLVSKDMLLETSKGNKIESVFKDPYLRGFHADLFHKEACYRCNYATTDRVGDITIGDFWDIHSLNAEWKADAGVSCIIINSMLGDVYLNELKNRKDVEILKFYMSDIIPRNTALRQCASMDMTVREQFEKLVSTSGFFDAVNVCIGKPRLFRRYLQVLAITVKKLVPDGIKKKIKVFLRRS